MRSRNRLILGALLLLLVACSGDAAVTTTGSPETTEEKTSTTTRPQLVVGGLVPFDPATLIPKAGVEPILIADSFQGVVSNNGRFAAVQSWDSTGEATLSVIDLDSSSVSGSVSIPAAPHTLAVADDGAAFYLIGDETLTLWKLEPGAQAASVAYDSFPTGFFSYGEFEMISPTTFGFFGVTSLEGSNRGEASVVVVDTATQTHTQALLHDVDIGIIGEGDVVDGVPTLETAAPDPVWDAVRDRVLIVEATRDAVTEVSLSTGEVARHRWTEATALVDRVLAWLVPPARAKGLTEGVDRDAGLSPDGSLLFVATRQRRIVSGVEVWAPSDLLVIDTGRWEARHLDAAVDTLTWSPDGRFLLAQGSEADVGGTRIQVSPVFVVDTEAGEPVASFEAPSEVTTIISFAKDGSHAYLAGNAGSATTIEILDFGLMQLTGSVGFDRISLIGEAGLMAFHLEQ